MKKSQAERNELLRYVLQHPPSNVSVKLPDGFDSLDNIDLALCPSPLPIYAEAEKAAANAKGGKVPQFEFDMKDCLVFVGSSSGGVQRGSPSPGSTRAKRQKSPREGRTSPEPKLESASPVHSQRTVNDGSGASSPSPNPEPSASPSDRQSKLDASPPHVTPSIPTAAPEQREQSKGFFEHIMSTFRGLSTADLPPQNSGSNSTARAAPVVRNQRRAVTRATALKSRPGDGSSLFSSLWNPLSSVCAARSASQQGGAATPVSEDSSLPDTARRVEQLQIPLCGSTPATMSETITRQFGPVFEAIEEKRRVNGAAVMAAKSFPRPPNIQLCEVLHSAPLTPFLNSLPVFAYDYLVLCTGVLALRKRDLYEREMRNVYRRVFNISDEQHSRTLANVTPPALKGPLDESDPVAMAERRRYIADMCGGAALLRVLCQESNDDDYISRTEQLLHCIENFPDSPGDTLVPFAIRAMTYAACLLPLYQLDLSTLSPIYTEKDVENCLALLRARLGISPQIEGYCHLHAQLLANDQCGSVEAQAVFLKDVARAVSSLGARSIAASQLTPPVKYAYYVLQETFCLAAVPMPWLDSTFSYDMQRSVSAVFIEACLALPPCMLSAMLLVEDMPVLPPSADGEAFLLAFMEVFVNSGVFRNYAELMDDDDGVGEHTPSSNSAVALLQQVGSGLDTKQKAYCKMLTRSFPLAMFLLVPGRLRIGSYVLLMRHWGNAYPNARQELPKDFASATEGFLLYLLGGCGGEKRVPDSEQVCSLLVRSAQTYLAPFSVLAKCEEEVFTKAATQQLEKAQLPWATTMSDATEPPRDARRFLRAVFDAERPPPLGSDPSSQQRTRLINWEELATSLLLRCTEGIPPVVPFAANSKVPFIAAECERIRRAAAARSESVSMLPGAVHRLHTIVRLSDSYCECVMRSHRKYQLVRCVSGAPAVMAEDVQEKQARSIYDAVLHICDTISIEILSSGKVRDMLQKFMRPDMRQYQEMKQSHPKNKDFPMPRAYPHVTMHAIIDEIKLATNAVSDHLNYEPAVRQVHYRIGHNFVAALFSVYVDGPGVWLSTADAPLILADLDLVRVAFFETQHDATLKTAGGDVTNNAYQSAAHVLRTSGAELLEKLYGIVQYVMSKPSAELTSGGVGVPPLHTLPDSSDDSPWCQFVVRRVLEHRTDFKKGMCINYQYRQRTKTMYS
jgi:hypothetical protein